MSRYRRIFVCMAAAVIFLLGAYQGWAAEWTPKEKFLKIGTASSGGLWYLSGARLAAEIEKNIPGIKVSSTTGGGLANPKNVNSGEVQFGITFTPMLKSAYYGAPPYYEGKPHRNLRVLYVNNLCAYTFVVSKDSKIYGFKDLHNARISPCPKYYLSHVITKWILEYYGITYESIKEAGGMVTGLSYGDATAMIQDKLLDGLANIPAGPMPHIINLAQNPGIRILPIEEEVREKILADPRFEGWEKMTIPARCYKGVEKPIPSIATGEVYIVHKDMSEELVYRIAKLIHESEGLKEIYKSARELGFPPAFDLSIAKSSMVIPVHPGAARFYKEKGITIPPIKE